MWVHPNHFQLVKLWRVPGTTVSRLTGFWFRHVSTHSGHLFSQAQSWIVVVDVLQKPTLSFTHWLPVLPRDRSGIGETHHVGCISESMRQEFGGRLEPLDLKTFISMRILPEGCRILDAYGIPGSPAWNRKRFNFFSALLLTIWSAKPTASNLFLQFQLVANQQASASKSGKRLATNSFVRAVYWLPIGYRLVLPKRDVEPTTWVVGPGTIDKRTLEVRFSFLERAKGCFYLVDQSWKWKDLSNLSSCSVKRSFYDASMDIVRSSLFLGFALDKLHGRCLAFTFPNGLRTLRQYSASELADGRPHGVGLFWFGIRRWVLCRCEGMFLSSQVSPSVF